MFQFIDTWSHVSHFKNTGNKNEKRTFLNILRDANCSIHRHRSKYESDYAHNNPRFDRVETLRLTIDALHRAERLILKMNCVAPFNHKYMEYEYNSQTVQNFAVRELILMKDIVNYFKDHQEYYCDLRKSLECPTDNLICSPIDTHSMRKRIPRA